MARRWKKDLRAHLRHSFWVINISKQNVCLADLGLTVPVGRSMDLLDKRHFSYTLEQLKKSHESGSLYKKQKKVLVRNKPSEIPVKPGVYISKQPIPSRHRSAVKVEEPKYEELNFSDERFADDFSSFDQMNDSFNKKD